MRAWPIITAALPAMQRRRVSSFTTMAIFVFPLIRKTLTIVAGLKICLVTSLPINYADGRA